MGSRAGIRMSLVLAALCVLATASFAQTPGEPGAGSTAPAPPDSTVAPPATTPATPPATTAPVTPPPAVTTPAPAATTPPPAATTPAAAAPAPPPAATTPPPAQTAQSAGPSGPFDRGRTRASFTVGWGRSFDDDYMLVGIGLGRYIKRGLELGLYYEGWVGADPGVNKLTPRITYVMTKSPRLTPYLGAFYTRAFIDGYDDLNSAGWRAGVYRGKGRVSYGLGAVWEYYLNFDETKYGGDASTIYPEIFIGTSF